VKYHAEFEATKGKFTAVTDDPESLRLKANSEVISNISYHDVKGQKLDQEKKRSLQGGGENVAEQTFKAPSPVPEQPRKSSYDPPAQQQAREQRGPALQPYSSANQPASRSTPAAAPPNSYRSNSTGQAPPPYAGPPQQTAHHQQQQQPQLKQQQLMQQQQQLKQQQLLHQQQQQQQQLKAQQMQYTQQQQRQEQARQQAMYQQQVRQQQPQQQKLSAGSHPAAQYHGQQTPYQHGAANGYPQYPAQQGDPRRSSQPQAAAPSAFQSPGPPRQVQPGGRPSQTGQKMRCYQAMYDYESQDSDEVSFRDGDIIINAAFIDEGWMTGTVHRTGQSGMLPANYVEPVNL
jgi:hypothetical protein